LQIIYQDKDITNAVEVRSASITDNAGGIADSVDITFADTEKLWGKWKPQKNDTVRLKNDGFDSGIMFVDELQQERGIFTIRALSIPQEAKTEKTRTWEQVRFLELALDICKNNGFTLQTFGVENWLYERVDQIDTADFTFLSQRCILEGYVLKLTDNKAVIYSEKYLESLATVKTLYLEDVDGKYNYINKSQKVYQSCRITYSNIQYEFTPPNAPAGPILKINNLPVSSLAEAERFSKNLLRYRNKNEIELKFSIEMDAGLAAGSMLAIENFGMPDGNYFISRVIQDAMNKRRTSFVLRKTLEGY
jgi:uncharacterized protein